MHAVFQAEVNIPERSQELAIQRIASQRTVPPAWRAWFVISSLPGALPGQSAERTCLISWCVNIGGRVVSVGGGSRLERSQGTVRALVPWNNSSACSSGALVSSPVRDLRGGTAWAGAAKPPVAYLEAVKRVEGVRDSINVRQWHRLASWMPARYATDACK